MKTAEPITMKRIPTALLASLAISGIPSVAPAGEAKTPAAATGGDWQWSLSAGPAWHSGGKLGFAGGSRSQLLDPPSFVGNAVLEVPPVGDASAVADRFYNDGYVRQDAGTAADGTTWFWGYDNASQVQGDSLVYHATGFESIRTDTVHTTPGMRRDSRMPGAAFSLRADATSPHTWGPFRVGATIGVNVATGSRSHTFTNHRLVQVREDHRLDYTDRYDLGGVIPPSAPYAGEIDGPGPLIDNIPALREIVPVLLDSDTAVFTNQVGASFKNKTFGIGAGLSLDYHQHPWTVIFSGGVSLEFHDYTAAMSETYTVSSPAGTATYASWNDKNSGVKVRPGLFAEVAARYDIGERNFIDGFVRAGLADDFSVGAGPSRFRYESSGVSFGVRIGHRF